MYLLDTNVISDFVRGDAKVIARLRNEAPGDLAISVITEMEVEYGIARRPSLAARTKTAMRDLMNLLQMLPFEREDAKTAGQLRVELHAAGTPLGAYDLLLAATARRRGLRFVTHNTSEFARVRGLELEDWRS